MSEDGAFCIKSRILKLFVDLEEEELNSIEQWISSKSYKNDLNKMIALNDNKHVLLKIGKAIKKIIPFEAEMSSEHIEAPLYGDQADCTKINTCHVDEFLYDDDQTEELVKRDKLKRYYCVDCNSRNVEELTFISHSMSKLALQYMFKVLLPSDLDGKQILDVGSRLGAVLYAAHTLSNANKIIGVEMNKECCDLQQRIISQFSFDTRIKVVHSDVTKCADIVQSSDIIVINVLDFFVDESKHKEMWYFFRKQIRKGSYLVTNRAMPETLGYLGIYEELMNWLSIAKPCQLDNEILFDVDEFDTSSLCLYLVN